MVTSGKELQVSFPWRATRVKKARQTSSAIHLGIVQVPLSTILRRIWICRIHWRTPTISMSARAVLVIIRWLLNCNQRMDAHLLTCKRRISVPSQSTSSTWRLASIKWVDILFSSNTHQRADRSLQKRQRTLKRWWIGQNEPFLKLIEIAIYWQETYKLKRGFHAPCQLVMIKQRLISLISKCNVIKQPFLTYRIYFYN